MWQTSGTRGLRTGTKTLHWLSADGTWESALTHQKRFKTQTSVPFCSLSLIPTAPSMYAWSSGKTWLVPLFFSLCFSKVVGKRKDCGKMAGGIFFQILENLLSCWCYIIDEQMITRCVPDSGQEVAGGGSAVKCLKEKGGRGVAMRPPATVAN